jgi:hypothetical protein
MRCTVPGCPGDFNDSRQFTAGRFCRAHLERYRRHGCAWLGSYTAADLNTYRRATWNWLSENESSLGVRLATGCINGLVARGVWKPVRQVARQSVAVKVSVIWGRFGEFDTDPKILIAGILAVWLRVADDYIKGCVPSGVEYRDVQTAKLLIRLAGGSVRRWPSRQDGGEPIVLKSFVSSEGRVLRVLGRSASEVAQALSASEWEDVRSYVTNFVSKHSGKAVAPYPQRVRVKHKPRLADDVKSPPPNAPPPLFAPDPDGGAPRQYVLNDDGSLSRLK